MFEQDLYHNLIEILSSSINLNLMNRAKRYHKSSVFNFQYSFPALPGWVILKQFHSGGIVPYFYVKIKAAGDLPFACNRKSDGLYDIADLHMYDAD